jgi:hypothetical protein
MTRFSECDPGSITISPIVELEMLATRKLLPEFTSWRQYWRNWKTIHSDSQLSISIRVENNKPKLMSTWVNPFTDIEMDRILNCVYEYFSDLEYVEPLEYVKPVTLFPGSLGNWGDSGRSVWVLKVVCKGDL